MNESQSLGLTSSGEHLPGDLGKQKFDDKSARMILATSFGLFAIYVVVVCVDSFPVRLLDPLWIIKVSYTFVNAASIPLVGVGLTHVAAALAPLNTTIHQRRRLICRLTALAALGFLLMLPLLGFATWTGISNVNQGAKLQAVALDRAAANLIQAVDQASSPQDLQKKMVSLQGPPISDRDLARPLAELKQTQKQIINQLVRNLINQIPSPTSDTYTPLYAQALRSALLSLVCSLAFAALAYDPLRKQTLLESLFGPRGKLAQGSSQFRRMLQSLSKALVSPFKKTFSKEARSKSLFWADVRRKKEKDNVAHAREAKSKAEKLRKIQIERERQRLQKERERNRQERKNKGKRDD